MFGDNGKIVASSVKKLMFSHKIVDRARLPYLDVYLAEEYGQRGLANFPAADGYRSKSRPGCQAPTVFRNVDEQRLRKGL